MRSLWQRFVAWWMPIAEVIGNFMNRLILSVFYFVIVLPFGLGIRLFADRLQTKNKWSSHWTDFVMQSKNLDDARKQF